MFTAPKIIYALLLPVSFSAYAAQEKIPARKTAIPTPCAKMLALQSRVDHLEAENKRLAVHLAKTLADNKTYKEELERQKERRTSALKFDIDLAQNQSKIYDRDAAPSSVTKTPTLNTTLFIEEETSSDSSPDNSPELAPQTPKAQQAPFERDDIPDLVRDSQESLLQTQIGIDMVSEEYQKQFKALTNPTTDNRVDNFLKTLKEYPPKITMILSATSRLEIDCEITIRTIGWPSKMNETLEVTKGLIEQLTKNERSRVDLRQLRLLDKAGVQGIKFAANIIPNENDTIEQAYRKQLTKKLDTNKILSSQDLVLIVPLTILPYKKVSSD